MQALYPAINVIGNFSGNLAHGANCWLLTDPAGNPADQVNISMVTIGPNTLMPVDPASKLRDPFADKSKPEAWAASIEGTKSSWTNVTSW